MATAPSSPTYRPLVARWPCRDPGPGRRTGTGGSAGVDYLDTTALSYRVFGDLWAVRTLQIPREAAPPLANAAFYGFRAGR